MIGLDTDVLVRYLTQDDERQVRAANRFFSGAAERNETLYVNDIVLCELTWILRSAYRYDRPTIASALEKILSIALFAFGDRDVVRQALAEYRGGAGDFADYLIGHRNKSAGCDHTVTFDQPLKKSPVFTLL